MTHIKYFSQVRVGLLLALGLFALFLVPNTTQAATASPACVLLLQTPQGSLVTTDKSEIMLNAGEDLKIFWFSSNAKVAENAQGKKLPLTGKTVKSPTKETTYTYIFKNGAKEISCSVSVTPVEAEIAADSLSSLSKKPTISGTASGISSLSFEIFKSSSKKPVYKSGKIIVNAKEWEHEIKDSLPNGNYSIVLYGDAGLKLNTITKEQLTIGTVTKAEEGDGTIVVQPIPLLSGGVAKKNQTVAISYLQVLNVGLKPVTITGIRVKQAGTASTDALVSLTAIDDTELSKGSVGKVGVSPFKGDEARIPITLILKPKETRLFTLKAIMGNDISEYAGDTFKLQVSGVESKSTVKGSFPIKGVTWTLQK